VRPFFAMIDVNYWQNPKVLEAGFRGGVVFQQLLIVNGANRCEGHIPPRFASPSYLARVTGAVFASREFPGDPVEWFAAGLEDAERAELIVRDITGIVIPGFATEWGAKSDSTDRMRRFRERQRERAANVTGDVTSSPVRHVTGVTSRDGRSDQSKSDEMGEQRSPRLRSGQSLQPSAPPTSIAQPDSEQRPGRATEPATPRTDIDATDGLALVDVEPPGEPQSVTAPSASPAKPAKPVKPEPPVEALTAAVLLVDLIAQGHPSSKLARAGLSQRDTTARKWADTMRLMNERDHIPYPAIMVMVDWAQRHAFWRTVILSADNLREKWDTMAAQRDRERGVRRPPGAAPPAPAKDHDDGEAAI